MDKENRIILQVAGLLGIAAVLFPPFQLCNGGNQPNWGFIGSPPTVLNWTMWEEGLPGHLRPACIHWIFLGLELAGIFMLAMTVWATVEDHHHHGH